METVNMYQVVDGKTGDMVGAPTANRKAARRKADRLDAAYGAVRYSVKVAK